ncbi:MAG: gephyrin-like molybdotransferase Glp [Candidatus Bathyarchaeia archaeon]
MRLKGFQKLTSVDNALEKFFAAVEFKQPKTLAVPLNCALNRVLGENVVAKVDVPRFNRSAVDGYAVNAGQTVGATQFKPKVFQLTNTSRTDVGRAKQVWTGNPIPEGADAVVMLEDTKPVKDRVDVWSQVTPGENVSKKGEDIRKGDVAAEVGTRLKPQHLGLIAALGMSKVKVFDKPKIAVLATGNELVELGNRLEGSQIFDTNKLVLSALCSDLGAEPLDMGIARDDVDEISERLRIGLEKSDVIITSGGTSVGGSDFVPDAVNRVAKPGVIVHGVAMRPAMPTALAAANGKPILILPGNPVAAIIGFEVFARPLICRMLGMKRVEPRLTVEAKMTRGIATALGRRNFVRVRVFRHDDELLAEPISARGSGMISTMTKANGFVIVPENREGLEEKEPVSVQLFDIVEG